MVRFVKVLLASVAALAISASAVCATELKTVVEALEQGYNALRDVRADFSQRTVIASVKREEKGGGELLIKKGSGSSTKFRFDYKKPLQQIVSDGKTAWYYLPENKQVMVSDLGDLFGGNNGIALNYLTGMGHVSRDFTIKFAGSGRDDNGNYVLSLKPKKANPSIAGLQLTVPAQVVENYEKGGKGKVLFPVAASVVDDNFGNRTFIELSRVRVNRGIGDSLFSFTIPKGVEVIKSR